MGTLFRYRSWILALALVGVVSCSGDSEEGPSINELYKTSDQFRLRLLDAGCDVTRRGSGSKAQVWCAKEPDYDQQLRRADLLQEWGEFLGEILDHPGLPAVSAPSYQSLQNLLLEEAENIENFVVTSIAQEAATYDEALSGYEVWEAAVMENLQRLTEFGCITELKKPARNIDEKLVMTCDEFQHATGKIEVQAQLIDLSLQSVVVIASSEEYDFHDRAMSLAAEVKQTTRVLKEHLDNDISDSRRRALLLRDFLRDNYGFNIRILYTQEEPLPVIINLPSEKRTQEHVDEMIVKVLEYVEAAEFFLEYRPLEDTGTKGYFSSEVRYLGSVRKFLAGPMDLEYIRATYEPEEEELEIEEQPQPVRVNQSSAQRAPIPIDLAR